MPNPGSGGKTSSGDSTSSQSRKARQRSTSRASHPYQLPREKSRAPMSMKEEAVEDREMDHSPESMPPLEDMSRVPVLSAKAEYSQQNTFTSSQDEFSHQTAFHQTFNDQRTI